VAGTFKNLPEWATFTVGTRVFQVSYHGGDGNDVVLTDVTPNTPPTISGRDRQGVGATAGTATGPIGFTVSDRRDRRGQLVVTAHSSNQAVISDSEHCPRRQQRQPQRSTITPAAWADRHRDHHADGRRRRQPHRHGHLHGERAAAGRAAAPAAVDLRAADRGRRHVGRVGARVPAGR